MTIFCENQSHVIIDIQFNETHTGVLDYYTLWSIDSRFAVVHL